MSLLTDLRHGLRVLRGRPLLTTVAGGSLALGIGTGTALFSVADAFSLRPLAVTEPDRLVEVFTRSRAGSASRCPGPKRASWRRRRRRSPRSPRSTVAGSRCAGATSWSRSS